MFPMHESNWGYTDEQRERRCLAAPSAIDVLLASAPREPVYSWHGQSGSRPPLPALRPLSYLLETQKSPLRRTGLRSERAPPGASMLPTAAGLAIAWLPALRAGLRRVRRDTCSRP